MIKLLCGCTLNVAVPVAEGEFKKVLGVAHDEEGFVTCARHPGMRRAGWRSVPRQGSVGDTPAVSGMNMWTPLECERWTLFGEIPVRFRTVDAAA